MCKPFVSIIIAAAGNSSRMCSKVSKQLIDISGKSVIEYSLSAFSDSALVDEIIVTAKADEIDVINQYKNLYPKLVSVVPGGKVRQESVANALKALNSKSEVVAIHDAARPLISAQDIDAIIEETLVHGAVCPVSRVVDTVKQAKDDIIVETLDRNSLFLASTPQTFKTEIYRKAFDSIDDIEKYTDDCSIVEGIGQEVHLYIMENDNTKITTPKDLEAVKSKLCSPVVRVGHGYDVHRLVENRKLILGGVEIPHTTGLLGHSDADVLLHAIMDALLGAAGLGDIGRHFPDTSDEFKGISSLVLLDAVGKKLKENGFSVTNIDATVIAQSPKLATYICEMEKNIANALSIAISLVNVKATTEEHLGFTGEKLGISAHSVCTITN